MGFAGMDFELDEDAFLRLDEEDPIRDAIYTRPVVRRPKTCCYENAEDFAAALTIDGEHETFAYVGGGFVFGDFVEALVEHGRLSVRRMGIQTLSLSDENVDSIKNICLMMPVERLDLVVSGYWYATEIKKGGLVSYLFDELDMEGLELHVAIAEVHCKVWTIETIRGNTITIHGSANMRGTGNLEQIHISPDPGLYEFCTGVGERIIEAYDVVLGERRKYKSRRLRGRQLWQAVSTATRAEDRAAGAAGAAGAPDNAGTATDSGRCGRSGRSPETSREGTTRRTGTASPSSAAPVTGGRDG